jgi:hypothetical protein
MRKVQKRKSGLIILSGTILPIIGGMEFIPSKSA